MNPTLHHLITSLSHFNTPNFGLSTIVAGFLLLPDVIMYIGILVVIGVIGKNYKVQPNWVVNVTRRLYIVGTGVVGLTTLLLMSQCVVLIYSVGPHIGQLSIFENSYCIDAYTQGVKLLITVSALILYTHFESLVKDRLILNAI